MVSLNLHSLLTFLLCLAALVHWATATAALNFTGSPAFISSNTSQQINITGLTAGQYTSVNFYVNGQFFCNGALTIVDTSTACTAFVPCVPANGTYQVTSQLVAAVSTNNANGPSLAQVINTIALCAQPSITMNVAAGPTSTNFDALSPLVQANVTLGYNATNVIVMIGNSYFCTIAAINGGSSTTGATGVCTAAIPCSAVGSCLPVVAFGTQSTGEPTPYETSGPGVLLISVNQTSACIPSLVSCGCPVLSAVAPGDTINFALKLNPTDSILNYQNLILTISNAAIPPLHVVLFESLTNLTMQCRMACCPGSPNSFLVFSWTIPCSYNNLGEISASLTYSIVNNCPGNSIQGMAGTPLSITIGDSESCFLTLSAAATPGPDIDPVGSCKNCCSSNAPLFPTNPFSSCYKYGFPNCAGCPTSPQSCFARDFASSCSCGGGKSGSNSLAFSPSGFAPSCCCGSAPQQKVENFPKACGPFCYDGLTVPVSGSVDFQAMCTKLNSFLAKINLYATNDLNFLALLLTEEALLFSCPSGCNSAAVKNTLKQIRYFELHGSAIPTLKALIYAYQVASETDTCLTPLITQILVNGIAQLNGALNCGRILQALVAGRTIYDEINALNPSFWTSTCGLAADIIARIQAFLLFEQSTNVVNLLTNSIVTLNGVVTCVCNNVPCCPTDPGASIVPVCQPCDGNPLCQLRPFDTLTFTICDGGEGANGTYALVNIEITVGAVTTIISANLPLPSNFPITCDCAVFYTWAIPCAFNNVGPATITLNYTFLPTGSLLPPVAKTSVIDVSIGYNPLCNDPSSSAGCC